MGLLPEVDKPEVQQDRLVVRADLERPPVDSDRLIGAVGAGVDHAEIAERRDVVRLLAENGLESPFRGLVVPCRERPYGPIEDFLRRLGGTEKKAQRHRHATDFILVIILPEYAPFGVEQAFCLPTRCYLRRYNRKQK